MINPNIALGVRTTQDQSDPLEQFAKIQGIRNLLSQAPLREAQLERARLENEQTRLENEGLPAKQAAAAEAAQRANRRLELDEEDKQLDMGIKKATRLGSLAGTIKDDATKDFAVGQAVREGIFDEAQGAKLLMQSYEALKPTLGQFTEQALSASQQAEERRKKIKDEVEAFDFEQKKLLAPFIRREKAATVTSAEQKATGQEPVQPAQKLANDLANKNFDLNNKRYLEQVRHDKAQEANSSATRADDKDQNKLLSPVEAATLGVPYGTTRKGAAGKMPATNAQQIVAAYASRMKQSGDIIDNVEKDLGFAEQGYNKLVPDFLGFLRTEKGKEFDQAKRNFINATLRRESGAVINPDEFKNAEQQYFPQPGDSADRLKQKRENRQVVSQSFKRAAGNAYQDPDELLKEAGVGKKGDPLGIR